MTPYSNIGCFVATFTFMGLCSVPGLFKTLGVINQVLCFHSVGLGTQDFKNTYNGFELIATCLDNLENFLNFSSYICM